MITRLWSLISAYDRRLWTLFFVQMIVPAGFGAAMLFISLYFYRVLGKPMRVVGTIMLVSAGASADPRRGGHRPFGTQTTHPDCSYG